MAAAAAPCQPGAAFPFENRLSNFSAVFFSFSPYNLEVAFAPRDSVRRRRFLEADYRKF